MILAYAIGGGLGHLVRTRAVLHTLGLSEDAVLLTASRFADDERVTGGLPVLRVPERLDHDRDATRRWLADVLRSEAPDRLLVDAFPAGVLGELCGLDWDGPVDHVARLLRWERYAKRLDGPLPRLEHVYAVEELLADHAAALPASMPLALRDPPTTPLDDPPDVAGAALVVHSGPPEEVDALVSLARSRAKRVVVVDVVPARLLFPQAAAIVTGAGFNAMRETTPFRGKHAFVAFRRPLDDQRTRAERARAKTV